MLSDMTHDKTKELVVDLRTNKCVFNPISIPFEEIGTVDSCKY